MVVETTHVWNTPGKSSFRQAMGGPFIFDNQVNFLIAEQCVIEG